MKKLFISIMTLAIIALSFGATTFAWFTLGTESNIKTVHVNVQSGLGMEVSLNGKSWKNNITLVEDGSDIDFDALSSYKENQAGIVFYDREGNLVSKDAAKYFEMTFYVRTTADDNEVSNFKYIVLKSLTGTDKEFANDSEKWVADLDFGAQGKYYEATERYPFDALNAMKVSFQANDDKAVKFIYSYGNDYNQGEAVLNGIAKAYSVIKEYNTVTPILTLAEKDATETSPVENKDYFIKNGDQYYVAGDKDFTISEGENPTKSFKDGTTYYVVVEYEKTTDTQVVAGKEYYTVANGVYNKVENPTNADIENYFVKSGTERSIEIYTKTEDKTRFAFAKTNDTDLADNKDYYTVANGVYTKVENADRAEIANYYEKGAANNKDYYTLDNGTYTKEQFAADADLDSAKVYYELDTDPYYTYATLPSYVNPNELYGELTDATDEQKTKVSILVQDDFQKAEDAIAEDGCLYGVANDADASYVYAKVTVRVWLEGWDADCINAILEDETSFSFVLKALEN